MLLSRLGCEYKPVFKGKPLNLSEFHFESARLTHIRPDSDPKSVEFSELHDLHKYSPFYPEAGFV